MLFSVVTKEEFKKISSTESAKEARTILQNTSEGTKAVKDSKFQRIPYTCNCLIIDQQILGSGDLNLPGGIFAL